MPSPALEPKAFLEEFLRRRKHIVPPSKLPPLQPSDVVLALNTYTPHLKLARVHRAYTRGGIRTVIATDVSDPAALQELNREGRCGWV